MNNARVIAEMQERNFSSLLRLYPRNPELYKLRGFVRYQMDDLGNALSDLSTSITLNPGDSTVYVYRALVHSRMNEKEKAIEDYSKSISLAPRVYSTYFNRGLAYYSIDQSEKAIEDFSRAALLNKGESKIYFNRGLAYVEIKDWEKAVQDFSKAIDLEPKYLDAFKNRGVVYDILGDFGSALGDYSICIALSPRDHEVYNNRGLTFEKCGDVDRALKDYSMAIALGSQDPRLFIFRGNFYRKMNHFDKAVEDFSRSIQLNPLNSTAYNDRGLTYFRMGKYGLAISDFSKAIELNPKSPEQYYNRGAAFRESKDYEKAMLDYTKSLELFPNDRNVHYNLGLLYGHNLGMDEKSIHHFTKCIEIEPKESKGYFSRGRIYQKMGETELSEKDFETVREIDSKFEKKLFEPKIGGSNEPLDRLGRELVSLQKRLKNVKFRDLDVLERLGSGVFGHTYSCRVRGEEGKFVVKIYKGAFSSAKTLKQQREKDSLYLPYHPNLVTIISHSDNEEIETKKLPDYEAFWKDEAEVLRKVPMILMRHYPPDLNSYLKKVENISCLKACLILQGMLSGAQYLHEKMIVHRDLHAGNILYDPENDRVWICDFGCALDLRSNRANFKVKKSEESLFVYQSGENYTYDRYILKVGGADDFRPPEIRSEESGSCDSNLEEDDEKTLDYSSYDIYSIGKIGMKLLGKLGRNYDPKMSEEGRQFQKSQKMRLEKFIDRLVHENKEERFGYSEALLVIRELILVLQEEKVEGENDGEIMSEEDEEEGEDADEDLGEEEEMLRRAMEISLQQDL